MFEKLIFWLNTDPNSKKKIILVVAGILILASLSFGLYSLNTQRSQQTQNNIQPVAISVNEVNQPTFDSSSGLKLVSNISLGLPQRTSFNPINETPVYFDKDFKMILNNVIVDKSPVFLPKTISYDKNNIIINEDFQTTLYLASNKQFLPLNSDVTFLTQVTEGNFLFVSNLDGKLNIRSTNSIGRTNSSSEFSNITPQINFQTYELRVFSGQVYLFVYSDFYRNENAEIWSIKEGNSTKILSLNGLSSTKFSDTGFLYTQNLGTNNLTTNYLDLSQANTTPTPIPLDFQTRLNENNISGQIIAERCAISRDKIIDCLVKEKSTDWEFFKNKDVLVKLNPISKIISFPSRDIIFSGESLVYSPNGSLYLVSQELRQLYKFEI